MLLAPNGRILAYLYPDRGVNLDAYLGQSMGIVGPRAFRPELQTDLIVVRRNGSGAGWHLSSGSNRDVQH